MNLDELQSVQSRERQTDQLQQLRATFYEEAGQFVAQLREERERAADRADDPFDSPEVNRLSDDIKTAEQTVEAVYERRVGKIVKMASLAAADMPTEDDGLTQEERALFETMVEAIKGNRQHVLDVIAGEAPAGAVGDGTTDTSPPIPGDTDTSTPAETDHEASPGIDSTQGAEPAPQESATPSESPGDELTVDAADIMGSGPDTGNSDPTPPEATGAPVSESGGAAPPEGDAEADGPAAEGLSAAGDDSAETTDTVERKTVRITDEVGEIFGVDQREYDLSTDDVVTLPADNADPLVERDAAEPLE